MRKKILSNCVPVKKTSQFVPVAMESTEMFPDSRTRLCWRKLAIEDVAETRKRRLCRKMTKGRERFVGR